MFAVKNNSSVVSVASTAVFCCQHGMLLTVPVPAAEIGRWDMFTCRNVASELVRCGTAVANGGWVVDSPPGSFWKGRNTK